MNAVTPPACCEYAETQANSAGGSGRDPSTHHGAKATAANSIPYWLDKIDLDALENPKP